MIKEKSSSATMVLYNKLFKPLGLEISPQTAECILSGIMTDTANFTKIQEGDNVLEVKDELLQKFGEKGNFSPDQIQDKFNKNAYFSPELENLQKDLIFDAKNSEIIRTKSRANIRYAVVSQKTIEQYGIKDSLPDIKQALTRVPNKMLRNHTDCGILFWEFEDGTTKISMRGNNYLNLSEFAKKFNNGGGHANAASFSMQGQIKDIVKKVMHDIKYFPF